MDIHLIWAQDSNAGIGKNGKLPWHVTEDLKNFKKITLNSTIIMGRKTWDSLPIKPLPNRRNIVLSSSKQEGVTTFNSYEKCLNYLENKNTEKIFIIGGRSIYKLFFNVATFLHITKISIFKENINEFFPIKMHNIEKKFHLKLEKKLSKDAIYTLWKKNI